MNVKRRSHHRITIIALSLGVATVAPGQNFQIDWYTIDGGGGFELEGTTGQPDV